MTEQTRDEVIAVLKDMADDKEWAFLNVPSNYLDDVYKQAADMLEAQQELIDLALQYVDNECEACGGEGRLDDAEPGDIFCRSFKCDECDGTGLKSIKLGALIKKHLEQ